MPEAGADDASDKNEKQKENEGKEDEASSTLKCETSPSALQEAPKASPK